MRNIQNPDLKNNPQEARRQFTAALEAHRLKLSGSLIANGLFQRCDATNKPGKSGKDDGQYVLHLDGVPRGAFINYTTDNGKWRTWSLKSDRPLTQTERQALDTKIKAEMAQQRAAVAEAREHARQQAKRIWALAETASADHPYAVAKKVEPRGLRYRNGKLWVPLFNGEGKLTNLQEIHADGFKKGLKGGRVGGCHYWVAKPADTDTDTICICEGWATGESIYQATKYAVLVAFNAGNLTVIAKWAREKIFGSPHHHLRRRRLEVPGNPGLTVAQEAAHAVEGLVAVPKFGEDRADDQKDFNDMANSIGVEAVKAAIDAAAAPEADEEEEEEGAHVRANQADALIALASDAALFHDDTATAYADIDVDGHREFWPIRSKGFREWLLHRYFRANQTAPSGEAMRQATDTIAAKARFDAPKREVFVRVGGHEGTLYLDLCDSDWRVVEIDAKGWRVTGNAPVRFRAHPECYHCRCPSRAAQSTTCVRS